MQLENGEFVNVLEIWLESIPYLLGDVFATFLRGVFGEGGVIDSLVNLGTQLGISLPIINLPF